MKETSKNIIDGLFVRYPCLNQIKGELTVAFDAVKDTFISGGTLFTCGNGGSAADSEHIVGELVKSFRKKRTPNEDMLVKLYGYGEDGRKIAESLEGGLPTISLTSHPSLSTAYANDRVPEAVFAQQLSVLGKQGDALIAISTSGNSLNCVYAALVAKAKEIKVIALTGDGESKLSAIADFTLKAPEIETYKVQELHLPIYHALCAYIEEELF